MWNNLPEKMVWAPSVSVFKFKAHACTLTITGLKLDMDTVKGLATA